MKSKRLVSMVALALALTGCKTTPATSSTTNHSSSSSSAEKASSSSSSKATSSTSKAMEKEDYKDKLDELIAALGEKKGYTLTYASGNVEKIIGEEAFLQYGTSSSGTAFRNGILKNGQQGYFSYTVENNAVSLQKALSPNKDAKIADMYEAMIGDTAYDLSGLTGLKQDANYWDTFTSKTATDIAIVAPIATGYTVSQLTARDYSIKQFSVQLDNDLKGFSVNIGMLDAKQVSHDVSFTIAAIGEATTDDVVSAYLASPVVAPAPTAFSTAMQGYMTELVNEVIPITGFTVGMSENAYNTEGNAYSSGDTLSTVQINDYFCGDITDAYKATLIASNWVYTGTNTSGTLFFKKTISANSLADRKGEIYYEVAVQYNSGSTWNDTKKLVYPNGLFIVAVLGKIEAGFTTASVADANTYLAGFDYTDGAAEPKNLLPALPFAQADVTNFQLINETVLAQAKISTSVQTYVEVSGKLADEATAITTLNGYITTLSGLGYTAGTTLSTSSLVSLSSYTAGTYANGVHKGLVVRIGLDSTAKDGTFTIIFAY
ncbi:MAG: hypothetical protein LKE52_01315 [Bacilli bacterium]|jgi:hypothetical protein|nr:hypothetical protein [Bacilli bacterium]